MSAPEARRTEMPELGPRRRPYRAAAASWLVVVLMLAAVAALYVGFSRGSSLTAPRDRGGGHRGRPGVGRDARGALGAPHAGFTTLGGNERHAAALRGRPTLLWFIAGGCASCGASVPVVARYLSQLKALGFRVVALDLFGDMPRGPRGQRELRAFARSLAGRAFGDPAWTWGFASRRLSRAYDPQGLPDVYYLLDRRGEARYRNVIPLDTMPRLLEHARRMSHG